MLRKTLALAAIIAPVAIATACNSPGTPCQNSLRASAGISDVGSGSGSTGITLTYEGSRQCEIAGVPDVWLLDARDHVLVHAKKDRSDLEPVITSATHRKTVLQLSWKFREDVDTPCPTDQLVTPAKVRIRLPKASHMLSVRLASHPVEMSVCRGAVTARPLVILDR